MYKGGLSMKPVKLKLQAPGLAFLCASSPKALYLILIILSFFFFYFGLTARLVGS